MTAHKPNIAVLGGGHGAFATAAHMALNGFSVNLFEAPDFGETIAQVQLHGGIEFRHEGITSLPTGFGRLNVVSTDPRLVLSGTDIVWVIVPAFAQKRIAELCAPYFTSKQIVVLAPGNFGGSIEFAQTLRQQGVHHLPSLVEAECMVYAVRKDGANSVMVTGIKKNLGVAAFPGTETPKLLPALRQCYPDLVGLGSVLETGLRNVNTVVHAPIMVMNAPLLAKGFKFYAEGCSELPGRVIMGIDRERMAVGSGLGLQLPSLYDIQLRWYAHLGAKGRTLVEVLAANPAYQGSAAPSTLSHRYVLEDVPYGMVPLECLGELVGVATPLTSAIISLASEMLGADLRKDARDLRKLGLDKLTPEQVRQFVGQWKGADSAYRPGLTA